MELNYPQQPNGMYVLNGNDLEHIATGVLSEFFPHNLDYPLPLNTNALFDDLGLFTRRFSVSKRTAQIRMIRLNLIHTQSRD